MAWAEEGGGGVAMEAQGWRDGMGWDGRGCGGVGGWVVDRTCARCFGVGAVVEVWRWVAGWILVLDAAG